MAAMQAMRAVFLMSINPIAADLLGNFGWSTTPRVTKAYASVFIDPARLRPPMSASDVPMTSRNPKDPRSSSLKCIYESSIYYGLLDRLSGFEWDLHNIGHIALHGVTPIEVEETTRRRHVIMPAALRRNEKRWKLFGRTAAGGYLVLVFTIRNNRMRTVTAYPMNQTERKIYAPQIDT